MTIRLAAKVGNRQTTFYVTGDSGTEYIVHHKRNTVSHRKVWTCNCPDFTERRQFNNTFCKHITEVQVDQAKQAIVAAAQTQATAFAPAPTQTAKQMIDSIVVFLNNRTREESRQLWDVLSALRGPDSDDSHMLKDVTTARLRGAIGLRQQSFAVVSYSEPIYKDVSGWDMSDSLKNSHNAQHHFAKHYSNAVQALKALGYIK